MSQTHATVDGHTLRSIGATGLVCLLSGVFLTVAGAVPSVATPPGNNGTIKIDGLAFDNDPDNEPHVDCEFQVDFYGYDEQNPTAEVIFEAHPPTGPKPRSVDQPAVDPRS